MTHLRPRSPRLPAALAPPRSLFSRAGEGRRGALTRPSLCFVQQRAAEAKARTRKQRHRKCACCCFFCRCFCASGARQGFAPPASRARPALCSPPLAAGGEHETRPSPCAVGSPRKPPRGAVRETPPLRGARFRLASVEDESGCGSAGGSEALPSAPPPPSAAPASSHLSSSHSRTLFLPFFRNLLPFFSSRSSSRRLSTRPTSRTTRPRAR